MKLELRVTDQKKDTGADHEAFLLGFKALIEELGLEKDVIVVVQQQGDFLGVATETFVMPGFEEIIKDEMGIMAKELEENFGQFSLEFCGEGLDGDIPDAVLAIIADQIAMQTENDVLDPINDICSMGAILAVIKPETDHDAPPSVAPFSTDDGTQEEIPSADVDLRLPALNPQNCDIPDDQRMGAILDASTKTKTETEHSGPTIIRISADE